VDGYDCRILLTSDSMTVVVEPLRPLTMTSNAAVGFAFASPSRVFVMNALLDVPDDVDEPELEVVVVVVVVVGVGLGPFPAVATPAVTRPAAANTTATRPLRTALFLGLRGDRVPESAFDFSSGCFIR
jgi:hypothetical protein